MSTPASCRRQTLHAEMGQIVAGLKPGRERDDETILFWHRGLSLSDIALAHAMIEKGDAARHRPEAALRLTSSPRLERRTAMTPDRNCARLAQHNGGDADADSGNGDRRCARGGGLRQRSVGADAEGRLQELHRAVHRRRALCRRARGGGLQGRAQDQPRRDAGGARGAAHRRHRPLSRIHRHRPQRRHEGAGRDRDRPAEGLRRWSRPTTRRSTSSPG